MPCKNLRGKLSLFAAGDLEPSQSQLVQDHVNACPNCRQQVQSFQKTGSMLRSYGQQISNAPQSRDLTGGIMGKVTQKLTRSAAPPGFQPPPSFKA